MKINFLIIFCFFLLGCKKKETIFKLVTSEKSGIHFSNRIIDSEKNNVLNFEYIYNGAGIASADFNNDGLCDLFFCGNQVTSKLYLNKGSLSFQDITSISNVTTSSWCTGVVTADINQDGWEDIYVCVAGNEVDTTKRANLLFINQGLNNLGFPTFNEEAKKYGLDDMGYSTQSAFFDYDLDGDLDCYILTNALEVQNRNAIRPKRINGEAPSNDRLYRNDNGKYTNVTKKAGILIEGYGLGLAVSDINQDGWPDIYCANDFLSNDLIWINNHDGTFTNEAFRYLKHQSYNGMGVDIADINNDSKPEIMVLDMLPESNQRQKMMLASSNHDRFQLDLKLNYQPQFMRNTLQFNQGERKNGTICFSEIGQLAGVDKTDWSWSPLFADFDNDGFNDLFITNGYRRDITNLDFTAYLASEKGGILSENKTIDNFEVFKKLKSLPEVKTVNYAFKNMQDLTFENVSNKWGFETESFSNGAIYADLDNDGDLDYVVNNIDDEAFLYENKTDKSNNKWIKLKLLGIKGNVNAIGAKIKVFSGQKTYYKECFTTRGYLSSVEPIWHFGLGINTNIDSIRIYWPNGQLQTIYKPITNQLLTIKLSSKPLTKIRHSKIKINEKNNFEELNPINLGISYSHKEFEYNDFNQSPLLPFKLSRNSPKLASADVNSDGLEDFFIGSDFNQNSYIYTQIKNGNFKKQIVSSSNYEVTDAKFLDLDSDGDLDLYCVSGGSHESHNLHLYNDVIYLNDGNGHFNKSFTLPTFASGGAMSFADFDGDGDLDIFRGSRMKINAYPIPAPSYFFENKSKKGEINFVNNTNILKVGKDEIGMVKGSFWVDVNADKLPDLIIASEWNEIKVLINDKHSFKSLKTLIPNISGLWQSIFPYDFDGDGDIDFALGNIGLNTKYRASNNKPLRIYSADFDNNGKIDPIMSYYLGDEEVPVPTRDLILMQLPGLKRYFPMYINYAKAKMSEILNKTDLNSSYKLEVTKLENGWVENRGNGVFKFHSFPLLGQTSVINTFQFIDKQLIMFGNSKSPETIGGWWDASIGYNFSFDKKNNVNNTPLRLFADGEITSSTVLKRKNDNLLILASINSPLKIYKIQKK